MLERSAWDETSGEVVDRARPGHHDGGGAAVARWDVLEFLARVLDPVPDPGQQLLRYRGWSSNAARGRRERRAATVSAAPAAVRDPDPDDAQDLRAHA